MGGFLNRFLWQFIEQDNVYVKEERYMKRIKEARPRYFPGGMPA